jgi:ribosomal protein S18 acetylase RimI-like enzyme
MAAIRTATFADLAAVVDLWNRAGGPTRHPGRVPEATRLLERDPDALLVAAADGRLVGTLVAGWDGWRFHLYRLAVEPGARRQGVARDLVAAARARAVALGASRVDAMVAGENRDAHRFWSAEGFTLEDHDQRWSQVL